MATADERYIDIAGSPTAQKAALDLLKPLTSHFRGVHSDITGTPAAQEATSTSRAPRRHIGKFGKCGGSTGAAHASRGRRLGRPNGN